MALSCSVASSFLLDSNMSSDGNLKSSRSSDLLAILSGIGKSMVVWRVTLSPKSKAAKLPANPSVCCCCLIFWSASGFASISIVKLRLLGARNVVVSRRARTFRTTGASHLSSLERAAEVAGLGIDAGVTGEAVFAVVESMTGDKPTSPLFTEAGGDG